MTKNDNTAPPGEPPLKRPGDMTMNDNHLPAKAEERPGVPFLWIIEAPFDILEGFCRQTGLDPDSAIPLVFTLPPERFSPARLTYPGAKCRQPEAWLRVLGLLHVHHVAFKLYQATGREGALTSLTQIRPAIDNELERLLGLAARDKIGQLRHYKRMLERVFTRLEEAAGKGFLLDGTRFLY